MVGEGFLEDAVNRIYYSVFYTVSALLYTKELYPKTHSGMKSLFNKVFIQSGVMAKEHGEFYTRIFAKRFEADYDDFAVMDQNETVIYLQQAGKFFNEASELIKSHTQHD